MKKQLLFACALLGSGVLSGAARAQATAAAPASAAMATRPLEYGVFFAGGVGVGDRSDFSFANAGVRGGKVLTDPFLPGLLRGQFEYAAELMPYWQSFTPPPNTHNADVVLPNGTTTFLQSLQRRHLFRGEHYAHHPAVGPDATSAHSALPAGCGRAYLDQSQVPA